MSKQTDLLNLTDAITANGTALKVDTIQTAAGGVPTASDLGINVAGSVLQVVTYTDSTNVNLVGPDDITLWSFPIHNVAAGSSIHGQINISSLMEYAGVKRWRIKNATGDVVGEMISQGNGNGGWRMPQTSTSFFDASPVVGTNTYYLSVRANVQVYYNYTTGYGNGITSVQMMEVAG
jgi:hypothetical protein